jgi:hypothetical protein
MKKTLICAVIILGILGHAFAQGKTEAEDPSKSKETVSAETTVEEDIVKKNLELFCGETFTKTKKCPERQCRTMWEGGVNFDGCKMTCAAKDCFELSAEECPDDSCQIIKGCGDKDICYYKLKKEPDNCGDIAYSGKMECCAGMIKRCGIENYDGTCDMEPQNSVYSAPLCIRCGNGYCNQFENKCNCPEDCADQ